MPRRSVDGVVLDIGVSSMQLDQAERGFSFRADGPLDMRMAQAGVTRRRRRQPLQAGRSCPHLRLPRRGAPCRPHRPHDRERAREKRPFERTLDLADAIETHVGRKPKDKIHPATRVFQALRIFVNDELGELASALFAAERALKPGGRLAVVTFHSLEDRIVKRFIADRAGKPRAARAICRRRMQRAATFEQGRRRR